MSKTKISRFEGTRGEKNQIFPTLKSCSHNSGTIPLFAPYPMTDQDLPEPVCPYANRVALKPFQALSSIPCPISLNTCFCENEKFLNDKLQLG